MGAAGGLGLGHRRGRSPWGRVTGLGPHETRLRSGLQPREERNGFKGPQQTNPCYPAGTPRQALSRACLLGPAPQGQERTPVPTSPIPETRARWGHPGGPPRLHKSGETLSHFGNGRSSPGE